MAQVKIEVYSVKEKLPNDGHTVLVTQKGWNRWDQQVYCKHYNCWDQADGDDFDRDISENDFWCSLPPLDEMELF